MPSYRPYRSSSRRRVAVALGLSLVLHVALLFLWIADEPLDHQRPVLLKYVKSSPPDRRLARRQVIPQIQRPLVRRSAVRPTPVAAIRPAPLTTRHNLRQGMSIPLTVTETPPPILPTVTSSLPLTQHIGPQMRTGVVKGVHQEAEEIDLNMELLAVDALDTGRHRALVVVDPRDRRNLKGFLYLSGVHSEALERAESAVMPRSGFVRRSVAERRTLRGLADKMSERTGVHTQVLDGIDLDDPLLMQVPFLLLTINYEVAFTQAEAKNLGRYLTSGGFLYTDIVSEPQAIGGGHAHDLPALRDFIRQAFAQIGYAEGKDWAFVRLPPEHPLYHCFYDIDSLPRGFWGVNTSIESFPDYLEGIEVDGRLVGLYSQKRYPDLWGGEAHRQREWDRAHGISGRITGADELPAYDLGVNILVYALTREGSLARQLVATD
ncbi:MAG: DUF4159 domain-containing protein [Gemmatimonadetes bacterium]|nr:DUF4159 domain-containing protein [Gemmatimonadota bacterium]